MNETAKNVLLWVIIAAVLFAVFQSFNPHGSSSSDLPYSGFVQSVDNGNVSTAVISADQPATISGKLKDGSTFHTVAPVLGISTNEVVKKMQDKGVEVDVVAIGQKAVQFFRRLNGVNLIGSTTHLGERPKVEQLIGVIKVVLDSYSANGLDRVFLAYNDFVNTMTQKPSIDALLPLPLVAAEMEAHQDAGEAAYQGVKLEQSHDWDYIYEPDEATVLEHILARYIESVVYQGVLENLASEHAARMVAMKAASDNATKVIGDLTLVYNKARQAAITQEISEIVGGAAAV